MTWVVDTCVLIDILKADPAFSKQSSQALQSKNAEACEYGMPISSRSRICSLIPKRR